MPDRGGIVDGGAYKLFVDGNRGLYVVVYVSVGHCFEDVEFSVCG